MGINLPSAKGKGRRAPMAEINVTPLVDVMLVLLIIFMVTAPLMTSGVPVNLPDSRAKAVTPEQEPLTLSMDAEGRTFLDDVEISGDNLPGELEKIAAAGAGATEPRQVMLRADRSLDYGRVNRVLGELNRAGLNRVSLISVAQ
ncbi:MULTISPECIES: ExbD/TolR family protein [unclassified Sphingomonas]|uniref:ExbD/TolR family protein n=1 Tax=unclassified Sphingomonas TaxID=196159 RepID=UPI00070143C3|nr:MULTISPECIES: ExbD/TolR family protein [unclassified Sphingomonas]KQN06469.1 protein TolR [Sphingomonas sp. Leaf25]